MPSPDGSGGPAILRVRDLEHRFGALNGGVTPPPILRRVSFEAQPGEIVAVFGPSGCGKTTLLTLLGGIRPIQKGSVRVDGIELRGSDPAQLHRLRARIGFVFQTHRLISFLTVKQNLIAAIEAHRRLPPAAKERRARELLASVDLADHADRYPRVLSGGQRQRAGLARALAHDPLLLLADEPTASLDHDSALRVIEDLRQCCRQRRMAVVMSTHDPRLLAQASQVHELRDGLLSSRLDGPDRVSVGGAMAPTDSA